MSPVDGAPVAVLLPVKAFDLAKGRLAGALEPAERADLAQRMATHVVASAGVAPVAVVCDDPGVEAWAQGLGAAAIRWDVPGLDAAVGHGVAVLAERGVDRVVIAHADLPFAHSLPWVASYAGVTIVPDRRDDGTNVLAVPARTGFRFRYGTDSWRRHRAEARRLDLGVRILRDPDLAWDVDEPADLTRVRRA